jgi:hypothetical protein
MPPPKPGVIRADGVGIRPTNLAPWNDPQFTAAERFEFFYARFKGHIYITLALAFVATCAVTMSIR